MNVNSDGYDSLTRNMYEFHDSEDSLFKHRTLICIAPSQNICPYSLRTPTYKLTFVGKEIHEKNEFIYCFDCYIMFDQFWYLRTKKKHCACIRYVNDFVFFLTSSRYMSSDDAIHFKSVNGINLIRINSMSNDLMFEPNIIQILSQYDRPNTLITWYWTIIESINVNTN